MLSRTHWVAIAIWLDTVSTSTRAQNAIHYIVQCLLTSLQINMLALYNIGPAVENTLGGNRFLALYLGSAVGGNLLGYMLGSGFSSSMGSSGARERLTGSVLVCELLVLLRICMARLMCLLCWWSGAGSHAQQWPWPNLLCGYQPGACCCCAGALYGIFAGYMVSRWVNRKAVPISQAEMMSIGTTVAINFALMTAFSGAMDTWYVLVNLCGWGIIWLSHRVLSHTTGLFVSSMSCLSSCACGPLIWHVRHSCYQICTHDGVQRLNGHVVRGSALVG
jgi:hypothetical protein